MSLLPFERKLVGGEVAMSSSRLHQLSALGQSVWIDYLSRDLTETAR
jgi:hypothetical protein